MPKDLRDAGCRLLGGCRIVSGNVERAGLPAYLPLGRASLHHLRQCMRIDIGYRRAIGCAARYHRNSAEVGKMASRDLRENVAYENAGGEGMGPAARDLARR